MAGDTQLGKGPFRKFITVRSDVAAGGSNLTDGQLLSWQADGTRDGIDVVRHATAVLSLFVGLVPEGYTINPQEYGLCQVYGIHNSANVYAHGTATNSNIVIGDIFVPSSGGPLTAVIAGAVITNVAPMFVAIGSLASSDTSTVQGVCKVFLRCM